MADFHVGQKVVCVNPTWCVHPDWPPLVLPEVGHEYVVRTICDYGVGPGLRLHWLINPLILTTVGEIEPQFSLYSNVTGNLNFLPVVERKTSISGFEKLLLTKGVREPENV